MSEESKQKCICAECSGENLTGIKAEVFWDYKAQDWDIDDINYDSAYCGDCVDNTEVMWTSDEYDEEEGL